MADQRPQRMALGRHHTSGPTRTIGANVASDRSFDSATVLIDADVRAKTAADLKDRIQLIGGQAQPHDENRKLVNHLNIECLTQLTRPRPAPPSCCPDLANRTAQKPPGRPHENRNPKSIRAPLTDR